MRPSLALLLALLCASVYAGDIFLTGHDIDYHDGQAGYDTKIIEYLRNDSPDKAEYDIVVIGSGAGYWRFSEGSHVKPGYKSTTFYNTADLAANPALWDNILSPSADVDLLVLTSHLSCGGCDLSDAGVNTVNSQASAIQAKFNAGMDLWINSGASNTNYYNFLPAGFTTSAAAISGSYDFYSVPDGGGPLNLVYGNMNGYPTHNRFTGFSSALTVVEERRLPGLPPEPISMVARGLTLSSITLTPTPQFHLLPGDTDATLTASLAVSGAGAGLTVEFWVDGVLAGSALAAGSPPEASIVLSRNTPSSASVVAKVVFNGNPYSSAPAFVFWDNDCNGNSVPDQCDQLCAAANCEPTYTGQCGAGLIVDIVATPSLAFLAPGATVTVTEKVTVAGQPWAAQSVSISIERETGIYPQGTFTTNAAGEVSFSYSRPTIGVDKVVASVTDCAGNTDSAATWVFWDEDCQPNGIPDVCDLSCNGLCGQLYPMCGGGTCCESARRLLGSPDMLTTNVHTLHDFHHMRGSSVDANIWAGGVVFPDGYSGGGYHYGGVKAGAQLKLWGYGGGTILSRVQCPVIDISAWNYWTVNDVSLGGPAALLDAATLNADNFAALRVTDEWGALASENFVHLKSLNKYLCSQPATRAYRVKDDGTESGLRCFETTSWGEVSIRATIPGPGGNCAHMGQNVFSITQAELNEWFSRNQALTMTIDSALEYVPHIIVLNIMDVTDVKMTGGFSLRGAASHANVLLNFCPAAGAVAPKANLGSYLGGGNCNGGMGIEGSILAPSVDVTACGEMHGQMFANSFEGPMAFHHGALVGSEALCRP